MEANTLSPVLVPWYDGDGDGASLTARQARGPSNALQGARPRHTQPKTTAKRRYSLSSPPIPPSGARCKMYAACNNSVLFAYLIIQ